MVDAANSDADRAADLRHKKADLTMDAFKHMTQINHDHRQKHRDRALDLLEHEDNAAIQHTNNQRNRAMDLLQHEDGMRQDMAHTAADHAHQKDMAEIAARNAMAQAKATAKQQAKKPKAGDK